MNHEAKAIVLLVALHMGVAYDDVMAHDRRRQVTRARDIAMLMVRRRMGLIYDDIALLFKVDSATAKRGVRRAIMSKPAQEAIRAIAEKM